MRESMPVVIEEEDLSVDLSLYEEEQDKLNMHKKLKEAQQSSLLSPNYSKQEDNSQYF